MPSAMAVRPSAFLIASAELAISDRIATSSHAPNIPERLIVEFEVEECIAECRK